MLQPFEKTTTRTPGIAAAMIIVGSNPLAVPTSRVFDLDTKVTLMHDVTEVTNEIMDTKSTLVIRNFPEDTKRILKTMAYQLGVPLHHLVNQVILKGLDAPGTAKAILGDRSKGNEDQQPEANEKPEDHRAEDLPRHREVRAPGRRKSAAGGVSEDANLDVTSSKDAAVGKVSLPTKQVPHCEHGTAKGYHCWQCGGLAKVGGKHDD